jgi:signal peptidase II
MPFYRHLPILTALAIFTVALLTDQISKLWTWEHLRLSASIPIFPPYIHFTYALNTGISFGLFQGNNITLAIVAVVLIALSFFVIRQLRWHHPITPIFTGLFLAGAIGNLIDRIRFHGVVDFIDVLIPIINYRWPTFNLADSYICTAVVLFIIQHMILSRTKSKSRAFSLFEVMLAVTIFALVVMSLAQAIKSTVESSSLIQRESVTRQLLQNALNQARAGSLQPGTFPIESHDPTYTLEKTIEPLELQNKNKQLLQGLYRISITATWKEGQQTQQSKASLIVYQP